MSRWPLRLLPPVLAATLALAAGGAPPAAAAFRCDSTSILTLVGVDTSAQRALFALPGAEGDPGWLIEADPRNATARAWPEGGGPHFAGSSGPGAVLAARHCGDSCVQVTRFAAGVWQPLGEPLLASDATTLHLTWDRGGAPWVVLHSLAEDGAVTANAYRFEGNDWLSKGGIAVHAVGNPGAQPAPVGEKGITSGDALFSPSGPARRWVAELPWVTDVGHGELLWLGGRSAAFLGSDGRLRVSVDGGASWQPVRWQAMTGREDLPWPGQNYQVELPDGERGAPLAAVWTDTRSPDRPEIFLAAQTAAGAWRTLVHTPQGILTAEGERIPYNHILRFSSESWALVTGCVARQGGASLAIRRYAAGVLAAPELLPIVVRREAATKP